MSITRRRFLGIATYAGTGAVAASFLDPSVLFAAPETANGLGRYASGEQMAATPATFYRAYRSKPSTNPHITTWLQIDLGKSHAIDAIKLYPACERMYPLLDEYYGGEGFPLRFKIEASDDARMANAKTIADFSGVDFPDPKDNITQFSAAGATGRYVRLTATELRPVKTSQLLGSSLKNSPDYNLTLAKIAVISGGRDVAAECPVTADETYGNAADLAQITRPLRPQGEGIVTDHPENVTPASGWKAALYKVQVPRSGVTLQGGIFQSAMENNIAYLMNSYSVDQLLRQFRERAGKPNPPGLPKPDKFWEEDLAGSNAGRFLMGAGNTVRWIDDPELRQRMNEVVDGIEQCRQPNGYIMAYPEDTIFYSERGAYTRAWLTHGLLEAGYAGNPKAFELLRGNYDWFNQCEYLPKLLRGAVQGGQGMIANTRMSLSPVGKPKDAQVIQQYFQENFWLEHLARREQEAVWQYPYDRPHCYLLTNLEAYADLYTATGDPRYRDAVLGGWNLYRNSWQQIGGSISIIEFEKDPPGSNYVHQKLGENCGSSFWILLSQRFHQHDPDDEKYMAEIEKSIYNVILANQGGTTGIRYHTIMAGKKEEPTHNNTCCEGQGTRMLGSLPEHIYAIAPDGVYVNLFEPSTLEWPQAGSPAHWKMTTQFPIRPEVSVQVSTAQSLPAKIRIRVPGWAVKEMPIYVNGSLAATGKPGTYTVIERTWADKDEIAFTLPIDFRLTRYTGADQVAGSPRYGLEYGPILMAVIGSPDAVLQVKGGKYAEDLLGQISAKPGTPLQFQIAHNPDVELMPYWKVDQETFTCLPVVQVT
ncbi:MAG: beta-L-arabinofuranosidase domain-containing protein [Acidobacteriaceae bacterium]